MMVVGGKKKNKGLFCAANARWCVNHDTEKPTSRLSKLGNEKYFNMLVSVLK